MFASLWFSMWDNWRIHSVTNNRRTVFWFQHVSCRIVSAKVHLANVLEERLLDSHDRFNDHRVFRITILTNCMSVECIEFSKLFRVQSLWPGYFIIELVHRGEMIWEDTLCDHLSGCLHRWHDIWIVIVFSHWVNHCLSYISLTRRAASAQSYVCFVDNSDLIIFLFILFFNYILRFTFVWSTVEVTFLLTLAVFVRVRFWWIIIYSLYVRHRETRISIACRLRLKASKSRRLWLETSKRDRLWLKTCDS